MSGAKPVFVCVLTVLTGAVRLLAADEAAEPPKQAKPTAPIAVEKSVLAESSKQAATPDPAKEEFCECVDQKESEAAKRIEKALNAPLHSMGIDFADQPLNDVLMQLQDEYGIPIQLDAPALEEAGVGIDSPVTKDLHNISLRSALRIML